MVSTNMYDLETEERNIHSRLRRVQERVSGSQAEFAREIGSSPANVSNYLRGRTSNVPALFVSKVLRAYPDVNIIWLLTGTGRPFKKREDELSSFVKQYATDVEMSAQVMNFPIPPSRKQAQLVPFYNSPTYSGWKDGDEPDEHFGFPRTWIRDEVGIDPNQAFAVQIFGPSMEDLLSDGDVVIGERCESVDYNALYALVVDNELLVRHVQRRMGGTLRLHCHSPPYSQIPVQKDKAQVLGRIARRITDLRP